jgi:uncharacterized membrane protein
MDVGSNLSKAFIVVATAGVVAAAYHAWAEGAFTTDYSKVTFSAWASFYGVPYWVFGAVWFPLVLIMALWASQMGRKRIGLEMLIALTIGNVFTAYLWYLDLEVVQAFTFVYVALYALNYCLTGLVVLEHRSSDVVHGYLYGTLTGGVVGALFGPYGVAACGIGGGIFGAIRNRVTPISQTKPGIS